MSVYGIKDNKALTEIGEIGGGAIIYDITNNAAAVKDKYINIHIPRGIGVTRLDVTVVAGAALTTYRVNVDMTESTMTYRGVSVLAASKNNAGKYLDVAIYTDTDSSNNLEIYLKDNGSVINPTANGWKNYNAVIVDNIVNTGGNTSNIIIQPVADIGVASEDRPDNPYKGQSLFGFENVNTVINSSNPYVTKEYEFSSTEAMVTALSKANNIQVLINNSEYLIFNGCNVSNPSARGSKHWYMVNETKTRSFYIAANSDTNKLTCTYKMTSTVTSDTETVNEIIVFD